MTRLSSLILVPALGFVVAANVGCMKCGENVARKATERALEAAVEKGTGGKADIDLSGSVDLSGLPGFAKYPNAQGKAKWSMSDGESSGTVYVLETGDSKDAVVNWYKTSLSGLGWKQAMELDSGEGTSLTYGSEDEKEMVNVTIATSDGKTNITALHSKKQ